MRHRVSRRLFEGRSAGHREEGQLAQSLREPLVPAPALEEPPSTCVLGGGAVAGKRAGDLAARWP